MKKLSLLSFLLVFFLSLSAKAQNVNAPGGKYKVYCEVYGYNFWGWGKVKVKIDMGRVPKDKGYESIYQDGKKKKFNTMMEVIDYMAKRGWEVHSTYVVTEGIGKQNVLHFLLHKDVTDDSQIDEGLELGSVDESVY